MKRCFFVSLFLLLFTVSWLAISNYTSLTEHKLQKPEQEIVLFTMPKTGTHLLRPLLENLTNKKSVSIWSNEIDCPKSYLYDKNMTNLLLQLPHVVQAYWLHQPIPTSCFVSILDDVKDTNDIFVTHAPYSEEMERVLDDRNSIVFFLIRDPRDWVISVIKHPPISGVDIFGGPMGDKEFLSLDMNQKIHFVIEGTPRYYSADEVFDKFLPWMDSPNCCTLRFEALLGPRGNTFTEKEQLVELRKIAKALHLNVSDEQLLAAFEASYGKGVIFSKGKAGTWKDHFTEEHKELFKNMLGDTLIELGYEKDSNW